MVGGLGFFVYSSFHSFGKKTQNLPHVFNFQCQKIAIEGMKAIKNQLTTVTVSSTDNLLWQWNTKLDSLGVCV